MKNLFAIIFISFLIAGCGGGGGAPTNDMPASPSQPQQTVLIWDQSSWDQKTWSKGP